MRLGWSIIKLLVLGLSLFSFGYFFYFGVVNEFFVWNKSFAEAAESSIMNWAFMIVSLAAALFVLGEIRQTKKKPKVIENLDFYVNEAPIIAAQTPQIHGYAAPRYEASTYVEKNEDSDDVFSSRVSSRKFFEELILRKLADSIMDADFEIRLVPTRKKGIIKVLNKNFDLEIREKQKKETLKDEEPESNFLNLPPDVILPDEDTLAIPQNGKKKKG